MSRDNTTEEEKKIRDFPIEMLLFCSIVGPVLLIGFQWIMATSVEVQSFLNTLLMVVILSFLGVLFGAPIWFVLYLLTRVFEYVKGYYWLKVMGILLIWFTGLVLISQLFWGIPPEVNRSKSEGILSFIFSYGFPAFFWMCYRDPWKVFSSAKLKQIELEILDTDLK